MERASKIAEKKSTTTRVEKKWESVLPAYTTRAIMCYSCVQPCAIGKLGYHPIPNGV
jgi:hypothetical protein